ncbi:MAG: hypothetical protein ACI4P6_05330 [Candidatus Spyradosoma sp.]
MENNSKKIILIGDTGSGKTTFMTVFSKSFPYVRDSKSAYLRPANQETADYILEKYNALRNQKWPGTTDASKLDELSWTLVTPNGKHQISICDSSGQMIGEIYIERDKSKKSPEEGDSKKQEEDSKKRTEYKDKLKKKINESEIIIFLLRLDEILDMPEHLRDKRSLDLDFFARKLIKDKKHFCVLISQSDNLIPILGKEELDCPYKALEHYCNDLAYTLEQARDGENVKFVSAVAETEVDKDGYSVPKSKFTYKDSKGMQEVMNWICEKLEQKDSPVVSQETTHHSEIPSERSLLSWKKKACDIHDSFSNVVKRVRRTIFKFRE